jgi:hypothetical protein
MAENIHIASIPTEYSGILFRSRLEARWAVFFTNLGLTWMYEPQKLTLFNGVRYIPDFYLPDIAITPSNSDSGAWIEIKPETSFIEEHKAKGMIVSEEDQKRGHSQYFLGNQRFQLFHVRYRHVRDLYKQETKAWFVEQFLMRTKTGVWSINNNARTYGKAVPMYSAVRAAYKATFD